MLYHSMTPASQATAQPVDAPPFIRGLNPYQQKALPAAFRNPREGGKPEDKEHQKEQAEEFVEEVKSMPDNLPEMFRLVLSPDFEELVMFFLTPRHGEILELRNTLRQERGLIRSTPYSPLIIRNPAWQIKRVDFYQLNADFVSRVAGIRLEILI